MIAGILTEVRNQTPLVHNITNYVTVNDVANIILAAGGAPIMADAEKEAAEIQGICQGLNINIGTLNERTIVSMLLAGKAANAAGHVTVLDPVGAGASSFRTETAQSLLKEVRFSVIRGNASEIRTIAQGSGTTKGVDADLSDAVTEENLPSRVAFAKELSKATGAVIAITGAIDIVADAQRAFVIRNGHPMMARITGTGCMLTGLLTACCAANPDRLLEATAVAVAMMGYAGEQAEQKATARGEGTGSFRAYLLDAISVMTEEMLQGGARLALYEG